MYGSLTLDRRGFYETTIGFSRKENKTTGNDDSNVIENFKS